MIPHHISIFALGGLNEIGKNMYAIQYEDEIIVIDSGLKFPEEDMPGVDLVLPDITYLIRNQDKIKGIFLTHGHEDHIGGLPYTLRKIQVPIYGARLTIGLVKAKLQEHSILSDVTLHEVDANSKFRYKHLAVSFFQTTHSIPDAMGIIVETPEGTIIHTGDFKIDFTPAGSGVDLAKLAATSQKGVLALLSDSTNSNRTGHTPSDQVVGDAIDELFHNCKGRILFATFASNVYRLQQVVEASEKYGRKIAVVGRSMEKAFQIGQELGYIQMSKETMIDIKQVNDYLPEEVTIICTGSQGEPLAALTRIAFGSHPVIKIQPEDHVIFSSSPIPGNATKVHRTIDQLFRIGANVIYGSVLDIHTSGHGSEEDLKLMLSLVRPKYFIPIHGEYRMLKKHAQLAEQIGIPRENIFLLENGEVLYLSHSSANRGPKIPSGAILVDGNRFGDAGNHVLAERIKLSEDGIILVVFAIQTEKFKLLSGPELISRGFVYVKESEDLFREAAKITEDLIHSLIKENQRNLTQWDSLITERLTPFFYERTERNPMIIPIMMKINEPVA